MGGGVRCHKPFCGLGGCVFSVLVGVSAASGFAGSACLGLLLLVVLAVGVWSAGAAGGRRPHLFRRVTGGLLPGFGAGPTPVRTGFAGFPRVLAAFAATRTSGSRGLRGFAGVLSLAAARRYRAYMTVTLAESGEQPALLHALAL